MRNVMIGREGLHRRVLLDLFAAHGASEPVSYISTGNVGFSVASADLDRFVDDVETGIAGVIGRRERLFVRTLDCLTEIVGRDPFTSSGVCDIYERLVSFTTEVAELDVELPHFSPRGDFVILEAHGRAVYSATMDGRTRSPGGLVERLVGDRITTRSWNTVQRVVARELARD